MSLNRSEPLRDISLHPALALLVTLLGIGAMAKSAQLLVGRLGFRPLLMIASSLLAAPAILALALTGRPLLKALGLRAMDRRTALVAAMLGLSLWVASLGILELQSVVWPLPLEDLEAFRRIHQALRPANVVDAIVSVIAIAAAPAICEETLMRGVVLPSLRPRLGALSAVLVSALAFALMHDPYRLVFTFAVGAILGVVRLRAEALLPCMVVHGTLNTLTFLVAPLVDDPSSANPDPRPALGAALLLVGLLVTLLLLRTLRPPPATAPIR